MTLVALFAMTTGAWADGTWTSGGCTLKLEGTTLTVSKNTSGQMADYTYYYERGWNNDASSVTSLVIEEGVTYLGKSAFGMFTKITEVTIPSTVTSIGDCALQQCYDLKTVTVKAASCTLGYRAFNLNSKMEHIYVPSDKVTDYKNAAGWSAYESIIEAAPVIPGEMTLNAAKTVATMEMPGNDVTVDYELARDMAVEMPVTVGDGNNGYRIRVKKDGESFVPAEMTLQQMMALFNVHDGIENQDLVFYGQGKVCDISIYAVDDQDQPTGQAIAFTALTPGRYVAIATAAEGTIYDGTTAPSNIFQLYQGYEVEVAAQSFITYYKDEALYVDESSATGELYTIASVTDNAVVLSSKIETAPAQTPLLVYNNSDQTRNILLIPTADPDQLLTVAPEFKGTLAAKTFSADDMAAANHYVLTAQNQFVWVKDAGTIGANKCWLEISKSAPNNARKIVFGDATGVNAVECGKLKVESLYDLNGRKLDKMPTKKGVYIMNGKKVVVK